MQHISSQLMDNGLNMHFSPNADYGTRVRDLYYFDLQRDLIEKLGQFEHTGDWDPFLIIELNDGTKIETASGYPEISWDIHPSQDLYMGTDTPDALPQTITVTLENYHETLRQYYYTEYTIDIKDLKSITLCR